MISGDAQLGFLVYRFLDRTYTDFYLWQIGRDDAPEPIIRNAAYSFGPMLLDHRVLAVTDLNAPNRRIVEVHPRKNHEAAFSDLIPTAGVPIRSWVVAGNRIYVSYISGVKTQIDVFEMTGKPVGRLPLEEGDTVRLIGGDPGNDEVLIESESFTRSIEVRRHSPLTGEQLLWSKRKIPFDAENYGHTQVWYRAKDGTRIPMFLVGRAERLEGGPHPTIMTSYGGHGISMTPQFSVLVAYLIEHGCLFALPNIRGGSEFGSEWHFAAKRRKRQVAFDDFLSAAEWLIETGRTKPQSLAIFGGSNSGLLVAAAMTQRPELFRAVVCMVPITDMLRYHLFDSAHVWKDEFGAANDPEDFPALLGYSPYNQVRPTAGYPATLIVSGDADQNCNPLHARKMTARLQAANTSGHPILLDYTAFRGHAPVLPLSERVGGLTDRIAFLCEQLQLVI